MLRIAGLNNDEGIICVFTQHITRSDCVQISSFNNTRRTYTGALHYAGCYTWGPKGGYYKGYSECGLVSNRESNCIYCHEY